MAVALPPQPQPIQGPLAASPVRALFGSTPQAAPPLAGLGGLPQVQSGMAGYNPYGTGSVVYGSGQTSPNRGPVSPGGQQGYNQRDAMNAARRTALAQRVASI